MNPNKLEALKWIHFALEDLKSAKTHAKEIILLIVNEFQNRGVTLNSSLLEIL